MLEFWTSFEEAPLMGGLVDGEALIIADSWDEWRIGEVRIELDDGGWWTPNELAAKEIIDHLEKRAAWGECVAEEIVEAEDGILEQAQAARGQW